MGADKTTIRITKELEDVRPNMGATTGGRPTSNYSWSGGFFWLKGQFKQTRIADITADAPRGSRTITLSKAPNVTVGQRVEVQLTDDENKSLLNYLYADDPDNTSQFTKTVKPRMVARVAAIDQNTVTLDRPLWLDIKTKWAPILQTFEPSVSEVGIENLTIQFPVKPYAGHFTELGMNAIAMNGVADCWAKNIKIVNADSGLFLTGINCTADGVTIESHRQPDPATDTVGHHAITMGRDCLLTNFSMNAKHIHDITVSNLATGNVVKNGTSVSLNLDHHKRAPYQNLFTNIDAGDGRRLWQCGGGADLGRNCGTRATFWNIRAEHPIAPPPAPFAPNSITMVGIHSNSPDQQILTGTWFEVIPPDQLHPQDLHAAQLKQRLKRKAR